MTMLRTGLIVVGLSGFVLASGCSSDENNEPNGEGSGGQASGDGDGDGGGVGGEGGGCFSPTQNLSSAYDGESEGCPCDEDDHSRCIEGVALICDEGTWQAVEDGPCSPSVCTQELDIDTTCKIASYVGFWHNSETGQCEPFLGGCPRNDNGFRTFEECAESCQDKITTAAVVPWQDCAGLGEQISEEGDESTFTRRGASIEKELEWSCGCPTGPVFTLAYSLSSPLELRLCKNAGADLCEAACSRVVSFDLSQALLAAETTDFVFAGSTN